MVWKLDRAFDIYRENGLGSLLHSTITFVFPHDVVGRWIFMVKDEYRNRDLIDGGFTDRLTLYRRGFLSDSYALYEFETYGYDAYLNDYARYVYTPRINGWFSTVLDNKLFTYWMLNRHLDRFPDLHGVIRNGKFYPTPDLTQSPSLPPKGTDSGEAVDALIRETGNLIVKGMSGARGNKVYVCHWEEGTYSIGERDRSGSEFRAEFSDLDDYIVTELIRQAPYADELYPHAANTVRVVTMVDPETDDPFIPMAAHRIGSDRSRPLDNFSRGGLSAAVDRETGELTRAARAVEGDVEWYDHHPDTGGRIEGTTVPGWSEIEGSILEIAASVSYVPYVGWDLLVTGSGEFRILEANNHPGVKSLQVHRPLLLDDRVRRFYKAHGVL